MSNNKATGVIRNLDPLGRLVIPKEIRKTFCLNINDPIEIYVNDINEIVLKKHESACIFCGKNDDVVIFNGKQICKNCISSMQAALSKE